MIEISEIHRTIEHRAMLKYFVQFISLKSLLFCGFSFKFINLVVHLGGYFIIYYLEKIKLGIGLGIIPRLKAKPKTFGFYFRSYDAYIPVITRGSSYRD